MSRSDRVLVAVAGAAVVLAAVAVYLLLAPPPGATATDDPAADVLLGSPLAISSSAEDPASPEETGTIFVDVQGGVAEPGLRELPAGSRIADAIAAAGGYAPDADLDAAATGLNLAKAMADGEQVRVPRLGDAAPGGSPGPAASGPVTPDGGGGGLVNLNTATPEQLEALPGIGAVTVQKIVAARQERPFSSLEDAVERGVIHRGQLEDIQGAATAG